MLFFNDKFDMHEHNQIEIPNGQKCELCGMLAEYAHIDNMSITHYYCSHHAPDNRNGHHNHHAQHEMKTAGEGHDKHMGHSVNMFRDRFWLSLIFTVPVVLYSDMVAEWLNFRMPEFSGSKWVPFVFGTIIFFLRRYSFYQKRCRRA
ncbi:MAG TPA: hypothetical protein VGQ87_02115 [Patescibacteria group bacterium]|jgi:cation transport ATPase|nr:hypothetical protein [Patescibacteria group bacterium]